jgi:hypothetical protein
MPMEARGIYRERNGWGDQHSARVKYDEGQELDIQKIDTVLVATSRRLIYCRGKTRAKATMPRGLRGKKCPADVIGSAVHADRGWQRWICHRVLRCRIGDLR